MSGLAHILDRAAIHVFMDLGLIVACLALLESQKARLRPMLPNLPARLMAACLLIGVLVSGREAYDLYHGQAYAKVWTDYASHIVGIAGGWIASTWLIKKTWRER